MTTPTTGLDGLRERAEKLLPCRQCNYSAPPIESLFDERKHYHAHAYQCVRCGFQSETGATWDEARAKWNARTPSPDARELVESRLKRIRLVRQEDANGCLVACLAMVTGRTYVEVKAAFPREDVVKGGLNHYHVFDYLTDAGFAFTRIQKYRWSGESKEREEWPVPFDAEAAICWVDAGLGGEHTHGMVALRDERVFDPIHGERRWSDYSKFGAIMPLYDLAALPAAPEGRS